ncbi:TIGR00266 family protein [bacterium]|nr:TIGR00266 family protein [bacterium]
MDTNAAWYVAVDGKKTGPFTRAELDAKKGAGEIDDAAYVYGPGMINWEPLARVAELGGSPDSIPPPPSGGQTADVIDYEIHGEEMQFVEITLDPGEATVAEAGAFMYMDPGVEMQTIFGDGSQKSQTGGFLDKMLSAGKRVLTGESLFMTMFGNGVSTRQRVAFASPYPGRIIPIDLKQHDGTMLCQKDAFLCAAKGVSVGIAFQRKVGAGLFGGEGFILQKLEGDGLAFVHAGGHVVSRDLGPGEKLRLDTGCLVAFESRIHYDVEFVKGIKTALFGGEGLFFATLTGPGRVFIQSLPFSRLASRVYAAAPQTGGRRRGEGSILDHVGGLGRLIDGD